MSSNINPNLELILCHIPMDKMSKVAFDLRERVRLAESCADAPASVTLYLLPNDDRETFNVYAKGYRSEVTTKERAEIASEIIRSYLEAKR